MNIPKETPTAPPPSGGTNYPWAHRVNYKSGKVQGAFAEMATPEQVKAGFSYYDKDKGETVAITAFDAIVVGSMCGVFGTTKDGGDKYHSWYSNLVSDTRTDILQVRMQGIDRPLHTGLYQGIKPDLPQGVGFSQVFICYVPQIQETIALQLTVGLSWHLRAAIAAATASPVKKIDLFGLCNLTTQYWGFSFTGEFQKVDKDGAAWKAGEMYFMPKCNAFVINSKPETAGWFDKLNPISAACSAYVSESQIKIAAAKPELAIQQKPEPTPIQAAAAAVQAAGYVPDPGFPEADVTSYEEPLPF